MVELGSTGNLSAAGQRIRGNRNVQIQEVENSWIQIIYDSERRVLPLESAELPISSERPSPARLVSARSGVFDYVGRTELLAELEAWIDSPAPFASYLVAGRGGSGKTRLAVELCLRLRRWDWLCGFLARGDGEGRLDALIEAPTARLVVIDYAENRAEQLERLLPQLSASASAEERVRVLLLVRTGSQRAEDASKRFETAVQPLKKVIEGCEVRVLEESRERLTPGERTQLFADAAAALGKYAKSASPPSPPPDLEQAIFENPLMVVIAAYLAAQGERAPATRSELLDGVLEHERDYWRESAAGLDADDPFLERAVAVATLLRAESEAQGAEHLLLHPDLGQATIERRNRVARWVRNQYPGPRWWNPLEPDLVGEHLVARCFADQPATLRGALAADAPEDLTRPLEVLGRAAADHPELDAALGPILSEELPRLCKVAIAQAGSLKERDLLHGNIATAATALDALLAAVDVEGEALIAASDLMPLRPDLVLDELASTLTGRSIDYLRPKVEADSALAPVLALALSNLSVRLASAGRHPEALAAVEEAVTIRRSLAEADPARFSSELASALGNLSLRLADAGRHSEALAAIEEALAIRRPLAAADPETHSRDLAADLNNLCNWLAVAGRHAEALAASEEAVAMRRALAKTASPTHARDLASALNNLSVRLSAVGRHPEALAAIEEAVATYRLLAEHNPAAYSRELASAMSNLSIRLGAVGRHIEALEAVEESVAIRRPLAESNWAAFAPELAMALNNLSNRLSVEGRHFEALAAIVEAVTIYRSLIEVNPVAYVHELASVLNNLSLRLGTVGRYPEALAASEESVATYRVLAGANPTGSTPSLASALNNLSTALAANGRYPEALAASEEAVASYRSLVEISPSAYARDFATALNNLSLRLGDAGRDAEALVAIEESVEITRQLVEESPAAFAADLALALNNLSSRSAAVDRDSEALEAMEESVASYRSLAADNPGAFAADLALALGNLSFRLAAADRDAEAVAASEEAVAIRRRLADGDPSRIPHLARSLGDLAALLRGVGRENEAEEAEREAARLGLPVDANEA